MNLLPQPLFVILGVQFFKRDGSGCYAGRATLPQSDARPAVVLCNELDG
jgi:hypothetical protein